MSYTNISTGGYPSVDPYREFERREAEYAPRDDAGVPIDECGRRLFEPGPINPEPLLLGDLAAIAAAAGVATSQGDGEMDGGEGGGEFSPADFTPASLADCTSICELARQTGWKPPKHLEIGAIDGATNERSDLQ